MTTVLHLSPTFYSSSSVIGGGEKYVLYMAKALMRAAKARGTPLQTALVAVGEDNGVQTVADGIELHIIPGRAWDAASLDATAIRRIMNDFEVIFIHQCLCGFGLFLAAQARMLGRILVGLDHGGGEHPVVARSKEVGTMFDLFLAYSDFGRHAFADLEGEVVMTRGPVDTEYYAPSLSTNRRSNDIIALGRCLPHKGFDRIIRSLPRGPRLKIIGSRTDEDYYQYLNELASGKSVVFVEGLEDTAVRDVLRSAGLFVHASCHFD